jgi:RNA polymerase sigma-70 factor, ECF subfamily
MHYQRIRRMMALDLPRLLPYLEQRLGDADAAASALNETSIRTWRLQERRTQGASGHDQDRVWLLVVTAQVTAEHQLRSRGARVSSGDGHQRVRLLAHAHRELVALLHWEGMPLLEAAETLGLDTSVPVSRYAAARDRLREALMSVAGSEG